MPVEDGDACDGRGYEWEWRPAPDLRAGEIPADLVVEDAAGLPEVLGQLKARAAWGPGPCTTEATVSTALEILIGAGGAVAALLAVLLPVILSQGASLRREIDTLRADVGKVRRDLHALSDRVARIEGALSVPWRPANGSPAGAGSTPEAAAE